MVSGQGAAVSSTKAGETCPFLDGVFVSVMRRIFSQGFHKQLLSEVELMAYCDETGSAKCEWINLPYKINVASVEVSVPVGNMEHTSMVVGVTTLVTCGATIYLIITMFRQVKPK